MIIRQPAAGRDYVLQIEEKQPIPETAEAGNLAGSFRNSFGLGVVAAGATAAVDSTVASKENSDEAVALALAEAREQGYKDGLQAGRDAGKEEWRLCVQRLYGVVEGIERGKVESDARIGEEAIAIAFEAIVKILGHKTVVRSAVAEAVEEVRRSSNGGGPFIVRVSPDDYEALLVEPSLIELEDQRGVIRLAEDPRVMLGGCIVESSRGTLDARLETQMERLRSVLLDAQKAGTTAQERQP